MKTELMLAGVALGLIAWLLWPNRNTSGTRVNAVAGLRG